MPTQEQILQLVKKLKPRLAPVLTTQDSVTQFLNLLAGAFGEQKSAPTANDELVTAAHPTMPVAISS